MCGSGITGLSSSHENAVREELSRLLESAAFRTSKRCREFLAYIVEHTISGQTSTLKERSIGVDLFRLPYDFDTGQHTIVRVTASEVRKKLAQHYLADNGTHHRVRIDLPPGSYGVEFRWEPPPSPPPSPPPVIPPLPPKRLPIRMIVACGAVLFVIAAAVLLSRTYAGKHESVNATTTATPEPVPTSLPQGATLRMIVGSTNPYVDRSGNTWGPDRFFSGGSIHVRPSERIFRTLDPDIYRHVRNGDFRYDIPLEKGNYELHLHFAETGLSDFISAESSGEGQRVFRVSANGKEILNLFDVVADAAGVNVSDERVFRNISPDNDGFLHLAFTSVRGTPILSGIEVLPENAGKVRPVRIRSGWPSSWTDSAGKQWGADSYFLGGNALVRGTNPAQLGDLATPDIGLYSSERWGHFSYAIPVADGRYRVSLKFVEGHFGRHNTGIGGAGSRLFDVYCNGVALLRNFDIYKDAGGEGRPIEKSFANVRPTAQGKIVLTFVPVSGMACVNGIEVVEAST